MRAFAFSLCLAVALVFSACDRTPREFEPGWELLSAFQEDFPKAVDVKWTKYREYAIATFDLAQKQSTGSMKAWYENNDNPRLVQVQSQMPGLESLPQAVQKAFQSSTYNDPATWRVDEVEVHKRHYDVNGSRKTVYKIELDAIVPQKPDVDLFYTQDGTLIKESKDYDDDDNDDWDEDDIPIVPGEDNIYVAFINRNYPGFKIKELERITTKDYGTVVKAEIEKTTSPYQEYDVYMREDASHLATGEEIYNSDLPQAVKQSLAYEYSGYHQEDAARWAVSDGLVLYSVELESFSGEQEYMVFFDAEGWTVKVIDITD